MCAGLMREGQQLTVLAQMEVTKEELDVDKAVRAALGHRGSLQLLWGNTLYHKDDLPYRSDMTDLPDVFTPFRSKVTADSNAPRQDLRQGKSMLSIWLQGSVVLLCSLHIGPGKQTVLRGCHERRLITVDVGAWQVEARCQVRTPLPAPVQGSLPLPSNLDSAQLSSKPSSIEDLNVVVPEGVPRLVTLQRHPNVSVPEKESVTTKYLP